MDCISTKMNQRLGLLCRIKHLLPHNAQLLFYNSLILPTFDYADIVWGDKNNSVLMSILQVLQNKAAKIILDRPPHSSATDMLNSLGWFTLEQRQLYNRCLYVFKCVNNLMHVTEPPPYMVLDTLFSMIVFIVPLHCALNITSATRYMTIVLKVVTFKRHES